MHYKIALCDDAGADRSLLDALVRRWAAAAGHTVRLAAFASAEQFLFHYAGESDYDILLLDVEMGEMDGVALAREIRRQNEAVQIIAPLSDEAGPGGKTLLRAGPCRRKDGQKRESALF